MSKIQYSQVYIVMRGSGDKSQLGIGTAERSGRIGREIHYYNFPSQWNIIQLFKLCFSFILGEFRELPCLEDNFGAVHKWCHSVSQNFGPIFYFIAKCHTLSPPPSPPLLYHLNIYIQFKNFNQNVWCYTYCVIPSALLSSQRMINHRLGIIW